MLRSTGGVCVALIVPNSEQFFKFSMSSGLMDLRATRLLRNEVPDSDGPINHLQDPRTIIVACNLDQCGADKRPSAWLGLLLKESLLW